jgi:MFS family permease/SAM-dependent methyltransferase
MLLETMVWIAIVPLAPTFADELGLSGFETGAILASASLAALVVALPLGVLADRLGARRVTIASAVVFTLATLGQGVAGSFWSLLLTRGLFGVAFGALWAAGTAWLSDASPERSRARALATTTAVSGVGFTLAPALAGLLADRYDTGTPFLAAGVAAAVVTAVLALAGPTALGSVPRRDLREVLRAAGRSELVLGALAIIVLIGVVGGGVNLLVPLQLRDNGVSAGEIGLVFSAASALYTVAAAVVARLGARAVSLRVGAASALLSGGTILLVLVSDSTAAAVAFVLLRAAPWATMDTAIFPLAAAGAHRAGIGRGSVLGVITLGWAAASTVGPLLAGALADLAGEQAAYATMIAACVVCGLWLWQAGAVAGRASPRVDLDRLYGAANLDELRDEYDRVAGAYDSALVDGLGWNAPPLVAGVAKRHLASDARILDVGAGTGLLGVELARNGLGRLDALDMSPAMLAEAERKHVYGELLLGRLGDRLDCASEAYDAVVASGVLTTGHAPATCLDELARITRHGGHVIFTLRENPTPPGFEEKIRELEADGRWRLVERGDAFQAMPNGHAEVELRVWVFRVL